MSNIDPPLEYAEAKLSRLRRRWEGPIGDAVRLHGPRLYPGVPASALLGLTASSAGIEEFGPAPDFTRGAFAVEAARVASLAADASSYLGRRVPPDCDSPDAAYMRDVEGQVVTGIMGYRRHLDALRKKVPAELLADAAATSFELRCMAAAYSSGDGITAAVLSYYAPQLLAHAPVERWGRLGECVAAETANRIGKYSIRGKWKVAFLTLRADQRAMCGMLLDQAVGGGAPPGYFGPWTDQRPDLVRRLRDLADD